MVGDLERLGVEFDLTNGVDGAALSREEMVGRLAGGVELPPGQVGCYMSHMNALERLVATGAPVGLVLEDDSRLDPRLVGVLRRGVVPSDWDYCLLNCDCSNSDGPVYYNARAPIALDDTYTAHPLSGGPYGTYAYFITRAAAVRRLETAYPIRGPIDTYHALPYTLRFRATITPKGSWQTGHHYDSYITGWSKPTEQLTFAALRRWPFFHVVRDLVRLHGLRGRIRAQGLVRAGRLPPGAWRPLPTGHVLLDRAPASREGPVRSQ